jgi:hypothetical protein
LAERKEIRATLKYRRKALVNCQAEEEKKMGKGQPKPNERKNVPVFIIEYRFRGISDLRNSPDSEKSERKLLPEINDQVDLPKSGSRGYQLTYCCCVSIFWLAQAI